MTTLTTFSRAGGTAAAAALALSFALAGCGSDTKSESTSSATSSSETSTSEAAPAEEQAGTNETIADYIKQANLTETPVKPGDPGSPTVDWPVPPGWTDAGAQAPAYAYKAIVFTGDQAMATNPPTIVAIMSKLSGGADPAKVMEYAPGELKNLPGWDGGDGKADQLSGFEAYQIGGSYERDGQKRMIAQKTVVIPAGPDLFVMQFNADGTEDQIQPLMDATAAIDENVKITAP